MARSPLRPAPFRGDPDVDALHEFLRPERQFAGDTLWSFGTSLKSIYVNSFEFLNHSPIVQLWRDSDAVIRAISRITLGAGEWFYQAAPEYRERGVVDAIIEQSDEAMRLLSARDDWRTVCYESDLGGARQLEAHGYRVAGPDEVYMTRPLTDPQPADPQLADRQSEARRAADYSVCELDPEDADQVFERGDAQTDAFREGQPYAEVAAWMTRTVPHQLAYGRPERPPSVIAVAEDGAVLAFADVFFDHENKIGEFEPVGTRKKLHRRGLAKAVLTRGLERMREAGMELAVVRTAYDNAAAIAAYSSVGFEVRDLLLNYRKSRDHGGEPGPQRLHPRTSEA